MPTQNTSPTTAEFFSQVLLVEDDASHAALITRACSQHLGSITHVTSVNSGVEYLSNEIPDLVLCDLNLGNDTGLTLLQAVKQIRPTLPVIIMTSSNQIQDAVNAMRDGAWDYVIKDFDDNFRDRLFLSLQRVEQRKQRELTELRLRAERDAFWAAIHTAQNGMAVLSSNATVIFANSAFSTFAKLIAPKQDAAGICVADAIEKINPAVATSLRNQLVNSHSDSLWQSEIIINHETSEPTSTVYELTLNAVSAQQLPDLTLQHRDLQLFRKYVLWVRDISGRRIREQFQRDLLSTTTHDIKGPLGAIITCVELLDTTIPKESREHELLLRIGSCARNSVTIIDELLSAKRIEDGAFVVRPTVQKAQPIIEETCFEFAQMAASRKLTLSHYCDPKLEIFVDKIALSRLLTNLISNAIKFTPAGGLINVEASHSGSEVIVKVTDNGHGIEANRRHILFEKYSRLDQHAQIDGTGLGLFIVRNIVDAHGGRIEVQSQVGQGTTFVVTFPDKQ